MTEKLNFYGLNDQKHRKILHANILLLEQELRTNYKGKIELFGKTELSVNPEPFRFLDEKNCSFVALILPFEVSETYSLIILFLSTPKKREEIITTVDANDLTDLYSYNSLDNFLETKILSQYGFNKSQVILQASQLYNQSKPEDVRDLFTKDFNALKYIVNYNYSGKIQRVIRNEISQFKTINEKPLSYFAKDAYKFPFSLVDLKPLIELVNDDDFSYQLDQAMAAYHENLFLPCASTLGVVLETLCIKILEENGVKRIKSGDTQLGKLKERLIDERIITRRDNTRLEVAYKMRNMASHSSPGVALKEDCHFMLNVINTIAFEYLQSES